MNTSGLLLITCCIVLAIWDMIAVWRYGIDNSVSRFVQRVGRAHPLFIFALGVLVGHFFAAMTPEPQPRP